jgi:2Fe-2S ferredoxin
MPKITYVQPDGTKKVLDAPVGTSVMKTAVSHGVPGIVAECGGSCMCATCHVYLAEAEQVVIPPMADDEDEMLDFVAEPRQATSRLSCQLIVTDALDGLVVHVPESQA